MMTEKKNKDFMRLLDLRVKPEDDRGGGNSQVGHDRKEEQGRSMVEMLGVLAVVGVLSVGGIAGYTYAMNKHYANELLAGASERAVLVTAQIASGRKPSLKEFANHTTAGGTFATEDESVRVYTDGIGIPVSGVKEAVCENLIKATEGTDILITDIDENEMSADNCAEESNDLLFVFETGIGGAETSGGNRDVGVCDNGNVYLWYLEDPCSVETPMESKSCSSNEDCENLIGPSGSFNSCCDLDTNTCMAGTADFEGNAVCPDENKTCKQNSDCGDGEFCNIDSYEVYEGDPMPDVGTCVPVGEGNTYEDFIVPPYLLSWWAGNNWCAAVNADMAMFEDLGCWKDGSFYECDWSGLRSWLPDGTYYVGNVYKGYKRWTLSLSHSFTDYMGTNNFKERIICKKKGSEK